MSFMPHSVNFRVVLLLSRWQRDKLLGHARVHPVAVDGDVLAGEQDLVLAVQRQTGFKLHVQAVLVTTCF